jgi:hypothetical protein
MSINAPQGESLERMYPFFNHYSSFNCNSINYSVLNKRLHICHDTTISMHQSNLKRIILNVVVTLHHYLQVKESLQ